MPIIKVRDLYGRITDTLNHMKSRIVQGIADTNKHLSVRNRERGLVKQLELCSRYRYNLRQSVSDLIRLEKQLPAPVDKELLEVRSNISNALVRRKQVASSLMAVYEKFEAEMRRMKHWNNLMKSKNFQIEGNSGLETKWKISAFATKSNTDCQDNLHSDSVNKAAKKDQTVYLMRFNY